MEKELKDKVGKILGEDFKLSFLEDDSMEVEFWSPAGEDVLVNIEGSDLLEMALSAKVQHDDFDADGHASHIYLAKREGTSDDRRFYASAPDSLKDLLVDAKAIKRTMKRVYDLLHVAAVKEVRKVHYA